MVKFLSSDRSMPAFGAWNEQEQTQLAGIQPFQFPSFFQHSTLLKICKIIMTRHSSRLFEHFVKIPEEFCVRGGTFPCAICAVPPVNIHQRLASLENFFALKESGASYSSF